MLSERADMAKLCDLQTWEGEGGTGVGGEGVEGRHIVKLARIKTQYEENEANPKWTF